MARRGSAAPAAHVVLVLAFVCIACNFIDFRRSVVLIVSTKPIEPKHTAAPAGGGEGPEGWRMKYITIVCIYIYIHIFVFSQHTYTYLVHLYVCI